MTLREQAAQGQITETMRVVAAKEEVLPEDIRQGVADGTLVIPANNQHTWIDPIGIGKGLFTKVNANIGTSDVSYDLDTELEKLRTALEYGATTTMDLSTWGDLDTIRDTLVRASPAPVGSVPIYQAAKEAAELGRGVIHMEPEQMFDAVERHAASGIDYVTVHCGVTRQGVERLNRFGRVTDMVSRGGTMMALWMLANNRENPFYEHFDRLLDIAKRYDLTLSLGDGLRPGSIADATDIPQLTELLALGELVEACRDAGVQAMVEGPGHVPLNEIEANVLLEKKVCRGAPFYILGMLTCDIGAGHDHITGAIGGAVAAAAGADMLCYVTPSEHLGLPGPNEVREGLIAFRIAAHSGDIVKLGKKAQRRDDAMSVARRALDWEGQFAQALDPVGARALFEPSLGEGDTACAMCGDLCVFKLQSEIMNDRGEPVFPVLGKQKTRLPIL